MRPAIDDVHHGDGEQIGARTTDITVERDSLRPCLGLGCGERYAQNGVGAEPLLVLGAIEIAEALVETALVGGLEAGQRRPDLAADRLNRLLDALAAVALAAIAELMRLVRAGRSARRDGGAAVMAVLQHHVDLDGRVAAAVKDLAADYRADGGHVQGPFPNVGPS